MASVPDITPIQYPGANGLTITRGNVTAQCHTHSKYGQICIIQTGHKTKTSTTNVLFSFFGLLGLWAGVVGIQIEFEH